MHIIDHNFVSEELANKIMESYGYEIEKEAPVEDSTSEEVVEESTEKPSISCVYEHDTGVYSLHSEVETINDNLYIKVSEVSEEDQAPLVEAEVPSLDFVDFEDSSYELGDIFEDPDGFAYVQLSTSK